MVSEMTSSKPYLVRAFYDWIVDNHKTPYVVVIADNPGTHVPKAYIEDGRIVLNASPEAAVNIELTNHRFSFEATFSGEPFQVSFPMSAVVAIYARENGRGMMFGEDEQSMMRIAPSGGQSDVSDTEDGEGGDDDPNSPPPSGKPFLTVVK